MGVNSTPPHPLSKISKKANKYRTTQLWRFQVHAFIDKMANRSVVQYFPEREGYKCGYCGNEDTSLSQGEASAHVNLSVDRYFVTR